MMATLFDQPPYQAHSKTSAEAAESMKGKTGTIRRTVLEALKQQPSTDEELTNRLQMNPNTVRPRRIELTKSGLIHEVGVRLTASNRKAVVWGVKNV